MSARTEVRDEVRSLMCTPSYCAENDGYATPAEIARGVRRNLDKVREVLRAGESEGLFISRARMSQWNPNTKDYVREYRTNT